MVDRVFHCIFDDDTGLRNRDLVGMDQICFETDYPHPDGSFPITEATVEKMCTANGLNQDETYKLVRGNAIRALGLHRIGITEQLPTLVRPTRRSFSAPRRLQSHP